MSDRDEKSSKIREKSSNRRDKSDRTERMGKRLNKNVLEVDVIDRNGNPVDNAEVIVNDQIEESGSSFQLENGEYTVKVNAETYQSTSQEVTLEGNDKSIEVLVHPEKYSLTVHAIGENEKPLEDATVRVDGSKKLSGNSFELENGDYTVALEADDYEETTREITVENANETLTVQLDAKDGDTEQETPEECQATTRSDDPCSNDAIEGSQYCDKHQPNKHGELTWDYKRKQWYVEKDLIDKIFEDDRGCGSLYDQVEDEVGTLSQKSFENTAAEFLDEHADEFIEFVVNKYISDD